MRKKRNDCWKWLSLPFARLRANEKLSFAFYAKNKIFLKE